MGKLLKIVLSIVATVTLIIIIAAVALPFFIDPNDFKPEIESVVKDNTGREISIEGDLKLSVFPWLGVSTGKITLSNAPGFGDAPFAEIEESNVKVKLIPLLSKQIEVNRIELKGLSLNLAKDQNGITNWDDLISQEDKKQESGKQPVADAPGKEKDQKESPPAIAALAIGGISLEDAHVVWNDRQADKHIELKDFNLKTESLEFDDPIGIDLSVTMLNKEPEIIEKISFSTDLILNEELDNFSLKDMKLETVTSGGDIPGGEIKSDFSADIALDLAQQLLKISGLQLSVGDLNLTAELNGKNILDSPVIEGPIKISEFNLRRLLEQLGIDLPTMQDSKALSSFSAQLNLTATQDSADINNLVAKLDDTNLKGKADINNFAKPAITFNLDVDAIDIDHYLEAATEQGEQSDKKGKSKKVATPAAMPAAAAAAGSTLFPVETLREINANGQIAIGQVKVNGLKMQGVKVNLDAKKGVIKTQQSINQFYQGSYTGELKINAQNNTPALSLNEKLSNVQIEPLLKDLNGKAPATGTANLSASLQGRGNHVKAIKSTLNGNISLLLNDGVVKGIDLQKIIDNYKSIVVNQSLPKAGENDQTAYSKISATAKIKNGLVRNEDLLARSSSLKVNGKGTAHLVTEKLDYQIQAKLIKREATETEPEKLSGTPVAIKVGGTFSNPSYRLDVISLLSEKNKQEIEEKKQEIIEELDEKLGPGASDLLKKFF